MKKLEQLALNDRSYSRQDNRRIARLCNYCRNAEETGEQASQMGKLFW
jgi:hypothetical protein